MSDLRPVMSGKTSRKALCCHDSSTPPGVGPLHHRTLLPSGQGLFQIPCITGPSFHQDRGCSRSPASQDPPSTLLPAGQGLFQIPCITGPSFQQEKGSSRLPTLYTYATLQLKKTCTLYPDFGTALQIPYLFLLKKSKRTRKRCFM